MLRTKITGILHLKEGACKRKNIGKQEAYNSSEPLRKKIKLQKTNAMFTLFGMFTPLTRSQIIKGRTRINIAGEDILWLIVDSTPEALKDFYSFAEFLEDHWKIETELYPNIVLAISEAFMNAIEHGNHMEKEKPVKICATRDDDYYSFMVEDDGDGFNYSNTPKLVSRKKDSREDKRGILIMKKLSDFMHFSNNGKSVKLVFYRNK